MKCIVESFVYVPKQTLLNVAADYRVMFGEDAMLLQYKNSQKGSGDGLMSLAYTTFVPSVYTGAQWRKMDAVAKKDMIRNCPTLKDARMLVIVNEHRLAIQFVKDYADRIDAIYMLKDKDVDTVFIDKDEYLSFAQDVKINLEFEKYGLTKTHDPHVFTYMYQGYEYTINLDELNGWLSYLDLGEFNPVRAEDPMPIADSTWRNRYYEVLTYAGNDEPKTLVGGPEDHNEAKGCRNSYIVSNCSKSIYLTAEMLHDRIEYIKAVRKMIRGHRVSESLFYDLDVIVCPNCKKHMKYTTGSTYSSCMHCGMSIPNPANVEIDIAKDKDNAKVRQIVADKFYKDHGYVTYDVIDTDFSSRWLGSEDSEFNKVTDAIYMEGIYRDASDED